MAVYFVEDDNIDLNSKKILITDCEDIKHITRVLRLNRGSAVSVLDGKGGKYECIIKSSDKNEVELKIMTHTVFERESDVEITIFQGISKGDRMDYTIQKCTELGVSTIIPVITDRTVVRFEDEKAKEKKALRWSKIAQESSKQSKRLYTMKVGNIVSFSQLEKMLQTDNFDLLLLPYELEDSERGKTLGDCMYALKCFERPRVGVVIGPEGGFEVREIEALRAMGAKVVTLGRRILRTETVGPAVSSVIQYEVGDM